MTTVDEAGFTALVERHRRELQVHCYRMLGSFDESEDVLQDTFMRAWRSRDSYAGRASFRAWLYRIATNACLDFLARHPRQPRPFEGPAAPRSTPGAPPDEIAWLQPYPDRLLAPSDEQPDAAIVEKETIELVFLAAIQHLPPRQRAVLILRDVLGFSANETAAQLELSVAAVKSALQRARPTLRAHLPEQRAEWGPDVEPTEAESALLARYIDAADSVDFDAMAALLHEDAKLTMPPHPYWFIGREAILANAVAALDPASPQYFGHFRSLPTRANRQPAVAHYVQRPGDSVHRAQVLDVLRVQDGRIVEITAFMPHLFAAFGLPPTLA